MEGSREGIMEGHAGNGAGVARKSPKTLRSTLIEVAAQILAAGSVDRLSQTLVTR
jgi:hypothetical protein